MPRRIPRDTPFEALLAESPAVLAPMEEVSDPVFRRLCRSVGARLCVTEFVNVEELLSGSAKARRKLVLAPDDRPTGIQIYGSNPATLVEAAVIAEKARPAFVDINCGCWIPRIAARGAGAGWLKDPTAMVAMAERIVRTVSLPVTVKTRIGLGTEAQMPIVDLARRLEDVGVQGLALHCRTARMRHGGAADWSWAARVQAVVQIPVLVNGDIRSAADVLRALDETGCAGVMVGRGAIDHPWLFREARELLEGRVMASPDPWERLEFLRRQLLENVQARGEKNGVECLRRHLRGYLQGFPEPEVLRQRLNHCDSLEGTLALLEQAMPPSPVTTKSAFTDGAGCGPAARR